METDTSKYYCRTFKKFCTAKYNLCYDTNLKCHVVTKLEGTHSNHSVGPELRKFYPEAKKPSSEIKKQVETLFENEAKSNRIRDVVLNSGILATRQDIQNLR